MKTALKWIAGIVVAFVAFVILAVLTLPIWLGPVVKPLANAAVPQVTKTEFHLGHLSLNPYTGRFEIGDLLLCNPANYSEKKAVELNRLALQVSLEKTTQDVVYFDEVTIDGFFASYLSAGGVNNFDQIKYNAAGGREKYEAAQKEKEAAKKVEVEKGEVEKGEVEKVEVEKAKMPRIVISKLVIKDIRLKYEMLVLPVPTVTLTGIGEKSGGVAFSELIDVVMQAILKAGTAIGDGAKALGAILGEGATNVGEQATKALDAVGAKKATEVVGEGAKATADAVGEGAKKAADAVGEEAKKAADALKKLF